MTWQEFKCKIGWHDWAVWTESVNDRIFDYQNCRNPRCPWHRPRIMNVGRKSW